MISLVLPTKNSMPHLKKAIAAIRRQTYRKFELIVQDGGSTDGTIEYLSTINDLPRIEIVQERDNGIGQAYNRGIRRASGDYLCLIASDECLLDRSLEMGASWVRKYPYAACIYGGVSLVNQEGIECSRFIPPPFSLLKFMRCEMFPTFGGILNRQVIGPDLFYDESLKTCPDFDFWLRIGSRSLDLINRRELFSTALADSTSMSYRPQAFEQFCQDKFFILDRYLSRQKNDPTIEIQNRKAKAGILAWAAREVMQIEGVSTRAIRFSEQAEVLHRIDDEPPADAKLMQNALVFHVFYRLPVLLKCLRNFLNNRLHGGKTSWIFLMRGNLKRRFTHWEGYSYWFKVRMRVLSGAASVCLMDGETIEREKIITVSQDDKIVYFPLQNFKNPSRISINFRNSLIPSKVEIYEISMFWSKK